MFPRFIRQLAWPSYLKHSVFRLRTQRQKTEKSAALRWHGFDPLGVSLIAKNIANAWMLTFKQSATHVFENIQIAIPYQESLKYRQSFMRHTRYGTNSQNIWAQIPKASIIVVPVHGGRLEFALQRQILECVASCGYFLWDFYITNVKVSLTWPYGCRWNTQSK